MTTTPRRPSPALGPLLILVGLFPIACSSGDATARTSTIEYDTLGDTIVARVQGAPL